MRVTITGGLGFLGRLTARRLLASGHAVAVLDVNGAPEEPGCQVLRGAVTDAALVGAAIPPGTDAVMHLASMVSAECERDFDAAFGTNLDGTRLVLEACRRLPKPPRLVFASSVAVFGVSDPTPVRRAAEARPPDRSGVVGDATKQAPTTTYGTTKAIGELLVNEYTRKGYVDGRSARLPTVVIRPGRPNAAASSFASGVFREPLAGRRTVVPVDPATPMVLIGHRAAVEGLVGLLDVDGTVLGADRAVGLPGLTVSVADMIAACRARVPGGESLIEVRPDPANEAVVRSWPGRWDASRALGLGLLGDRDLDGIIDAYLADFV
jgi:nucleoside-diphosphate-sugar epimerase